MIKAFLFASFIPFTLIGHEYTIERELYNQRVTEYISLDTENRVVQHEDYFGNITHFVHADTHTQIIDPMGNSTFLEKNSKGKLLHNHMQDAEGNILSRQEYTYTDNEQLLLQIKDYCYAQGESLYTQDMEYEYNAKNLLSAIDFGNGDIMRFGYQEASRLRNQITFPNGRNFFLHPDAAHPRFTADDGSVNYHFHHCDHWLNVYDKAKHVQLRRKLCPTCGMLTKEELPTKHTLAIGHTPCGKVQCIKIPKFGCIHFVYEGCDKESRLLEVQRQDCEGNVLYSHKYTKYDAAGNVLIEELPFYLAGVSHFNKKC